MGSEILLKVRNFALVPYEETLLGMRQSVDSRIETRIKNVLDQEFDQNDDELWVLEHLPVYTLGQASKPEHLLTHTNHVPLVQSDRGGQITYHGPGQIVIYVMIDISRKGFSVRDLVCRLEQAMISFLANHRIEAHRKKGAPGVYIDDAKIGSIGLRIRRGISYHGLSFNVDMDLSPFDSINPCGFSGLKVVQLRDLISQTEYQTGLLSYAKTHLVQALVKQLDYTVVEQM